MTGHSDRHGSPVATLAGIACITLAAGWALAAIAAAPHRHWLLVSLGAAGCSGFLIGGLWCFSRDGRSQ